jgi:MSHA biogenesis protein MshP
MRPDKKQRGLGIIAAIVILVIFAGLSAFIARLSSGQAIGSALDVQGSQAYLAAHAGLEWAKFQTVSASCAASTPLTGATAVNGYTVTVTCATINTGAAVEAGLGSIYLLTATACNDTTCPQTNPGANYVERRLTALIER